MWKGNGEKVNSDVSRSGTDWPRIDYLMEANGLFRDDRLTYLTSLIGWIR